MKTKRIVEYLTVIVLIVVSIAGMLSWNTGNSFYTLNQYGEEILMWGSGVYATGMETTVCPVSFSKPIQTQVPSPLLT